MLSCKCCLEKDKRIADLKTQLESQNALIKAVVAPAQHQLEVGREMQYALEGQGSPKEPLSEAEQQAIAMLTGSY